MVSLAPGIPASLGPNDITDARALLRGGSCFRKGSLPACRAHTVYCTLVFGSHDLCGEGHGLLGVRTEGTGDLCRDARGVTLPGLDKGT